MSKDYGNCGVVRKAAGETGFPHRSHVMARPLTGKKKFDNFCAYCFSRMWGNPDDWNHDVALEKECLRPPDSGDGPSILGSTLGPK